jgi:drug/metabolite transporter (DMT)-like permease
VLIKPQPYRENIQSGILLMLAYSLFALIIDSFAKKLVFDVTTNQVVWARFIFHSLALVIFFGPKKFLQLSKTENIKLQIIRSLLLTATTFLFFSGIYVIGLATAHSIFFLTPILVTALAIPLLGERVGVRRSFGVFVGFIGALLIIRPGFDNFRQSRYILSAQLSPPRFISLPLDI